MSKLFCNSNHYIRLYKCTDNPGTVLHKTCCLFIAWEYLKRNIFIFWSKDRCGKGNYLKVNAVSEIDSLRCINYVSRRHHHHYQLYSPIWASASRRTFLQASLSLDCPPIFKSFFFIFSNTPSIHLS